MSKTKRKENYGSKKITPYGLRKTCKNFDCKVDYHLHEEGRKILNWWEDELEPEINNKTVRRIFRQKVKKYRLSKLQNIDL